MNKIIKKSVSLYDDREHVMFKETVDFEVVYDEELDEVTNVTWFFKKYSESENDQIQRYADKYDWLDEF